MARAWRIEYEGARYHVLLRGRQRQAIFTEDADCQVFLNTLGEMAQRFDVEDKRYEIMKPCLLK